MNGLHEGNRIFVNDKPLDDKVPVANKSVISIGNCRFRFDCQHSNKENQLPAPVHVCVPVYVIN